MTAGTRRRHAARGSASPRTHSPRVDMGIVEEARLIDGMMGS